MTSSNAEKCNSAEQLRANRSTNLIRLAGFFSLWLLFSACHKTGMAVGNNTITDLRPLLEFNPNLIRNSSLDSLDSWSADYTNILSVFPGVNGGTQITHNAAGHYYIYQQVNLLSRQFYKISVTVDYILNNYAPVGMYVMDTAMTHVLGKFERAYSSAVADTWQFVFYSRQAKPVRIVLGFLNGANGSATFRDVSLRRYVYQPLIRTSPLASYLAAKVPLRFTRDSFDASISRLGDYMNYILLGPYKTAGTVRYRSALNRTRTVHNLIKDDSTYAYFDSCLLESENVSDAYCQKSSICMGLILSNEFNIPVRQIYMQLDGTGIHQFWEYWNPFSQSWVIVDLYFSIHYVKDGHLLGDDDLTPETAPNYIQRFGSNHFYSTTDELLTDWQTCDMNVTTYYSLTFPFL
jgi:hypothetical protein